MISPQPHHDLSQDRVEDIGFSAANGLCQLMNNNHMMSENSITDDGGRKNKDKIKMDNVNYLNENDKGGTDKLVVLLTEIGQKGKFPDKLMRVLDFGHPLDEIISWTPDGLSFTVRCPKKLEDLILPLVFSTRAKFSSFQRKLYRWGFTKRYHERENRTYFHKHFKRGEPMLCVQKLTRPQNYVKKQSFSFLQNKLSTGVTSSIQNESISPNSLLPPPASVSASTRADRSLDCIYKELARIKETLSDLERREAILAEISSTTSRIDQRQHSAHTQDVQRNLLADDRFAMNNIFIPDSNLVTNRKTTSSTTWMLTSNRHYEHRNFDPSTIDFSGGRILNEFNLSRLSAPLPSSNTDQEFLEDTQRSLLQGLEELRQKRLDHIMAEADMKLKVNQMKHSNTSFQDGATLKMILGCRKRHSEVINIALNDLIKRQRDVDE